MTKTAAQRLIDARREMVAYREAAEDIERQIAAGGKKLDRKLAAARRKLEKAKDKVREIEPVARAAAAVLRRSMASLPDPGVAQREARPRAEGRRQIEDAVVESPYGREHGYDKTSRNVHVIEAMYKRRQITTRMKAAADRYRWAFEACPGEMRCALNQEGGGGGMMSRSPTDQQLMASEYLRDALTLLGATDEKVVYRVCGEGLTVEEAAQRRYNGRATRWQKDVLGVRLREALELLADHWWRKPGLRGERMADAKPSVASGRRVPEGDTKGRVAHAAPGKIYGFEPEGGQPHQRPRRAGGKR